MTEEYLARMKRAQSTDSMYDENDLVSTNECTGLIPGGDLTEAQAEQYGELYSIHPSKANR